MSGTALATVADMGTYQGQISHYASVKGRLGIGPVKRVMVSRETLNALPRRKRPHEFLHVSSKKHLRYLTTAQKIIEEICLKHKVSRHELMGEQRSKPIVHARHEAFYRMKKETKLSLARVGERLGGRDHSTVLNGIEAHIRRNGLAS